jgi:diaminopimelate epimerase
MRFAKMNGAGNDFIVVNAFKEKLPRDLGSLALSLCNRNFGIGGDGLIVLSPVDEYDAEFAIYNADGSQAEMCGNGIRCAAVFARREGICLKDEIVFLTLSGKISTVFANAERNAVKVNMGKPRFSAAAIPALYSGDLIVSAPLPVGERVFSVTLVSMGNPHCVIFVENAESFPLYEYGPLIEKHPYFPAKINVEFAQIIDDTHIRMRVWERGCGITLACGTGACAAAIAANLNGFCAKRAEVRLDGGILQTEWLSDGSLEMTGMAELVFWGETT